MGDVAVRVHRPLRDSVAARPHLHDGDHVVVIAVVPSGLPVEHVWSEVAVTNSDLDVVEQSCRNVGGHCSFLSLWLVVSMLHTVVSVVKRASRGLEPRRLPVWLPIIWAVVLSRPRRRTRGRCAPSTRPRAIRARR